MNENEGVDPSGFMFGTADDHRLPKAVPALASADRRFRARRFVVPAIDHKLTPPSFRTSERCRASCLK
jgi:hypothetical protein